MTDEDYIGYYAKSVLVAEETTPAVKRKRFAAWIVFPATVFFVMCPIVFVLEGVFRGAEIKPLNAATFILFTIRNTLIALIPLLLVCSLVALANLIAYKRRELRMRTAPLTASR